MDQVAAYQATVRQLDDRPYTVNFSQREFVRILEKRAIAMSKKSNSLSQLDAAFCAYLIDYLINHECKSATTTKYRIATYFSANLTGIFTRALENLSRPRTEGAERFIKRYNQIGRQTYEDWQNIQSIQLTHIDGPDYRLDITHIVRTLIHDIFGDYEPVDFAVLESERKVVILHFQRFMKKVWEEGHANKKELEYGNKSLYGIFGKTKFTTYHVKDYLIFKFSDAKDDYYSLQLAVPDNAREGYNARIAECKVDLISALHMIENVATRFKLDRYIVTDHP